MSDNNIVCFYCGDPLVSDDYKVDGVLEILDDSSTIVGTSHEKCAYKVQAREEDDKKFYAGELEFQDEYPVANEPFGRYPWEK